jgi:predicted porin
MRKVLRAGGLAVLASAAGLACAQSPSGSQVTLYGLIDMGFEHSDVGAVTAKRLSSGISTGSRWGLRGQEELSPGWKAIFTLESRFEADTGTMQNNGSVFTCANGTVVSCPGLPPPTSAAAAGINSLNQLALNLASNVNSSNALFDRQAYVGLVTPVGAVLFGRQYTPGYETLAKFSAFGEGFAGSPAQLSQTTIRMNNAVQYRVEQSGFIGSLMYSFGGSEINRNEKATSPQRGDDFYGGNLQYATDVFGVGVGYNRNNTITYAAQNEARKGLETWSLGGYVATGPFKWFGSFLKAKNSNPALNPGDLGTILALTGGNATQVSAQIAPLYLSRGDVDGLRGMVGPVDLKVFHLGGQWSIAPSGTLIFGYNWAKDTARSAWATADAKVGVFGLAYIHKLSLRTQLYASGAIANNQGQSRVALGGAGYIGGLTTGQGTDNRVVQLGVRHAF